MSNSENSNEQGLEGEQVLRFQSEIEEQGQRVALALNAIAEALDNGGNISREMMNHVKAQILRAHLHLDDLEQMLDAID